MTSCDTLPCSATLGKIATLQKEAIAGIPSSSIKQKDVKPEKKPTGLLFCPRPSTITVHPGHVDARECCVASRGGSLGSAEEDCLAGSISSHHWVIAVCLRRVQHLSLLSSKEVLCAKYQNRPQVFSIPLSTSPLHGFPPLQLIHTCASVHCFSILFSIVYSLSSALLVGPSHERLQSDRSLLNLMPYPSL